MIGGGIGWEVGANNGGQLSTGEKRGDTALTTRCHVGLRGHFPKKCLLGLGKREREAEAAERREEKRRGRGRRETRPARLVRSERRHAKRALAGSEASDRTVGPRETRSPNTGVHGIPPVSSLNLRL